MKQSQALFSDITDAFHGETTVTVERVLESAGTTAFGTAFLLLTAVSLLPYASYIMGAGMMLLGIQVLLRYERPTLPKWALSYRIDTQRLRQAFEHLESILKALRVSLSATTIHKHDHRLLGSVSVWSAFILALPLPLIPFNNILPALSLLFVSFCLLGACVAYKWLAVLFSALGTAYFVTIGHVATLAVDRWI